MVAGIIEAERCCVAAVQVLLFTFFDARDVVAENIFEPGNVLHAALAGSRQDTLKDVERAEVRGAEVFERRVAVVLRMNRRVAASTEALGVVLLLPVIGERLIRDLPACDTAS